MTGLDAPGKQFGNQTPAKPSSPRHAGGETTLNNLPVLTEVIVEIDPHMPRILSAEERQQLLHQLEKRIETLFSQKLALYLEQEQRLAIDRAIGELKTELPELLREALSAHLNSR